jgi:hypothetical protein
VGHQVFEWLVPDPGIEAWVALMVVAAEVAVVAVVVFPACVWLFANFSVHPVGQAGGVGSVRRHQ